MFYIIGVGGSRAGAWQIYTVNSMDTVSSRHELKKNYGDVVTEMEKCG
jgi:hypothetical protein